MLLLAFPEAPYVAYLSRVFPIWLCLKQTTRVAVDCNHVNDLRLLCSFSKRKQRVFAEVCKM